jgi:hypothetical protein
MLLILAVTAINMALCSDVITLNALEGIGFREQELSTNPTSHFLSDDPTGIEPASFGGGTHIFIKGSNFNEDAQSNIIMMYSDEYRVEVPSFPLSDEDAFNSNPKLG